MEKRIEAKPEEDDMPPELEDFSEELSKIRLNRGENHQSAEIKVNVVEKEKEKEKINNQVKEEEFGSFMKRGFFKKSNNNSNTNTNTNKVENTKVEDLTHIKSNKESANPKIFDQVKKEIEVNRENTNEVKSSLENIVNKKDEWLNQELLMKIAQKPELMKAFMDPRFSEVIGLMQTDPKEALTRFGHVKEFNEFIKEFSGIMAEHFGKLGKEKEKSNPSNNLDSETEEILQDPKISPIIYKLQTEGKLDIEEIQKDQYISTRIKKLIDKGVLRIQKESELNK